jgi:hypothetical protein
MKDAFGLRFEQPACDQSRASAAQPGCEAMIGIIQFPINRTVCVQSAEKTPFTAELPVIFFRFLA